MGIDWDGCPWLLGAVVSIVVLCFGLSPFFVEDLVRQPKGTTMDTKTQNPKP